MLERISRRDFLRQIAAGCLYLATRTGEKSPPKPDWTHELAGLLADYPEIDKKIRGCEWIRTAFQRNIVLIGKLDGDKDEKRFAVHESALGIDHLNNSYLINTEATACASWSKTNLGESVNPNLRLNCLQYFALLLFNESVDFHQIGTDFCFHDSSDRHYGILGPTSFEAYQQQNPTIINSIQKISESIFFEVHNNKGNPNCVWLTLKKYGDRLTDLAVIMQKNGQLTFSQELVIVRALRAGEIDYAEHYLFVEKKVELEKKLKKLKKQLGLPDNWN